MPNDNLVPFDAEHQESWALLPWHVNHTLAPSASARVERHSRECLVCHRELTMLKVLAEQIVTPIADAECEAALQRMSARLARAPLRPRQFPWSAAAMLAMTTALLAWTADNAANSTAWLRNAGFSTAAMPVFEQGAAPPNGPQVNLVFYDDITERELRSLVLAVGAAVVEGPTPQGVYTLAFARQMSPGEVMEALRRLRYSRSVLFAEPAVTTKVSSAVDW
jgi:hypothetical protein